MILLESPSRSAGLAAWLSWASELDALPAGLARDDSVKLAKSRAARMIQIMTQFPNGMPVKDPRFLQTVREFDS